MQVIGNPNPDGRWAIMIMDLLVVIDWCHLCFSVRATPFGVSEFFAGGFVFVSMRVMFGMFERTIRCASFIGLFRRNATALGQPRPSAWVTVNETTPNPNGVTLIDHDDCLLRSSDGIDFIRADCVVRELGPPRWGSDSLRRRVPRPLASSSKLSIQIFLRIWSKRIVTICEISHALESKPKCLSSWFRFFAVHIPAE